MMDRYGKIEWDRNLRRTTREPDPQRSDFYDWSVFLGLIALVAMLAVLVVW